jgi:hypothetical protein
MTTVNKRYQPVLFFSGGSPEEEDTLESKFPYLGLIGKKGMWKADDGYSVAEIALLGKAPGDCLIQLVRVDSASPVIPTQYMLAWWSDEGNAMVTTESDNASRVAGVFMADLTAVTDQRVTYIAKDGLYPTLYVASPTVAPDALGKQAIPGTDGKADCVNAAASVLYVFGRTAGTQVNDATSRLDDTALTSLKIVD